MSIHSRPTIYVTAQDFDRLTEIVSHYSETRFSELADALDEELARATIVEANAMPPDVVTMRSTCRVRFLDTNEEREVTLVYPNEADVSQNKLSILAPVGAALLGLPVGETITWPTLDGERQIQVLSVSYQPEASGEWHL